MGPSSSDRAGPPTSSSLDTDATPEDRPDTATRILDCAQARIQRRGYNAVSYGDLAEELDLTTAAIHYHFPSKADLVQTLVRRYRRHNAETRATIGEEGDTLRARLDRYIALFADVIDGGGLCLCGVLAADGPALPTEVRREVRQFFAEQGGLADRRPRGRRADAHGPTDPCKSL